MQNKGQWWTSRRSFVAGFLLASLGFSSVGYGASWVEKNINVVYRPIGFMFDGVRKAPPEDQLPFLYNGRTYVPLRFMAEALGKHIEYDAQEGMIYVGRRPDKNRPGTTLNLNGTVYHNWTSVGSDYWRGEFTYYDEISDINGVAVPNSWVVRAGAYRYSLAHMQKPLPRSVTLEKHWVLDGKYETLSGELFPTKMYKGYANGIEVGYIVVKDEFDKVLYTSPTVKATGVNDHIHFKVPVTGVGKIKVQFVVLLSKDAPVLEHTWWNGDDGDYYLSELGIANFGLD